MFPEYIDDYISEDNPVRVIDAYVDTLDFKEMSFTKTKEKRQGAPGYHPSVILKLYIYGYMNSIRSSRKLEKETYRNTEVIWLLKKLKPDFKTIADFRKDNKKQLQQVFKAYFNSIIFIIHKTFIRVYSRYFILFTFRKFILHFFVFLFALFKYF